MITSEEYMRNAAERQRVESSLISKLATAGKQPMRPTTTCGPSSLNSLIVHYFKRYRPEYVYIDHSIASAVCLRYIRKLAEENIKQCFICKSDIDNVLNNLRLEIYQHHKGFDRILQLRLRDYDDTFFKLSEVFLKFYFSVDPIRQAQPRQYYIRDPKSILLSWYEQSNKYIFELSSFQQSRDSLLAYVLESDTDRNETLTDWIRQNSINMNTLINRNGRNNGVYFMIDDLIQFCRPQVILYDKITITKTQENFPEDVEKKLSTRAIARITTNTPAIKFFMYLNAVCYYLDNYQEEVPCVKTFDDFTPDRITLNYLIHDLVNGAYVNKKMELVDFNSSINLIDPVKNDEYFVILVGMMCTEYKKIRIDTMNENRPRKIYGYSKENLEEDLLFDCFLMRENDKFFVHDLPDIIDCFEDSLKIPILTQHKGYRSLDVIVKYYERGELKILDPFYGVNYKFPELANASMLNISSVPDLDAIDIYEYMTSTTELNQRWR